MATKIDRTDAEEAALEAVTKKLSASYPDLVEQLENASMSTDDYVEAIKRACEQQAEQQRQQQAQETYVAALEKQAQLEEEIAKATANVTAEQERMNNMSGWDHFWTIGEWDDLEAYQAALEELTAAQAENEATIARIEQDWADAAAAAEAAADGVLTYEQAVSTAYESVRGEIEELCAAYDEAYQAHRFAHIPELDVVVTRDAVGRHGDLLAVHVDWLGAQRGGESGGGLGGGTAQGDASEDADPHT